MLIRWIKMIIPTILCVGILAPAYADEPWQSIPDEKYTDVNQVGLMINNNGFLGTNLPNELSPPSFEYPLGTDLERLIRGGIWIGAINVDNDTLVSTGTIDGAYGWDAFQLASQVAQATSRIPIRTGVVNPYDRHPIKTGLGAMTTQTLAQ